MKTVMKKMFSLLLVAVLMVSAVPAAFAAAPETAPCPEHGLTGTYIADHADNAEPTCSAPGKAYYACNAPDGVPAHEFSVEIAKLAHLWTPATCTTKQTCQTCGGSTGDTLPHTEAIDAAVPATCSATGLTEGKHCSVCNEVLVAQTEVAKLAHTETTDAAVAATCTATGLTEGKHCSVCNEVLVAQTATAALGHNYVDGVCTRCQDKETETHEVYFSVNGNQEFWHLGVKHNQTVKNPGFTYGTDYTYLSENVGDTATQKFMGWSKNPSDTNGSALEYIVEMPVTQSVTYYAIYQAKQPASDSSSSGSSGSGSSGSTGSNNNNSTNTNIPTGSHSLKVYARIWVHETKFETRLLDTITGLSSDAKIYQVIAANKNHLNAILPYDEFKALHWSETVNYLDDDKEYKDVGTRMTVGDENEVYVNLYSAEQLIVVNVHTSKTWAYDLSVRIEGFRPGDLVTYEDVLKAVKKYYNVSSMKMFTYEEMCDYLEGGKADQIDNFIAGEKDDPYEVFISGSRKSGAYKYTADSTNPKTGDEIFVPMAVLGLSASALAVMFYLNKKRSY